MNTTTAAAKKRSTQDVVAEYQKRKNKVSSKVLDKTNTFAEIMENTSIKDKQKAKELRLLLTGENALENLEMLEKYKQDLQEQRKEDNKAIIDATDSEVFSDLKDTIDYMHQGVMDIGDQLEPFTSVVKALHTMRNNGVTVGVIQEIIKERDEAGKRQSRIEEIQGQISLHEQEIKEKSDDRILFFGPVKNSSKLYIENAKESILSLEQDISALEDFPTPTTEFDLYIEEKKALAGLLNINSEEHKAKQEKLIQTALGFVETSDEQMKNVLGKFEGMSQQVKKLAQNNYKYNQTYSVLNDASKGAIQDNIKDLKTVENIPEAEDAVDNLENQRQKRKLSMLVEDLRRSHTDTAQVSGELIQAEMRIETLRKSNEQQFQKAQVIQSSGIAGVAAGLSTTLQAVNRAAIGETSESARMAIEEVNKISLGILKDEMISSAEENKAVAESINKAMAELVEVGATFEVSSEITREALQDIKSGTDELEGVVKDMRKTIEKDARTSTDVLEG